MSGITLQEVGGSLVVNVPEEQTQIGRGQFLQVTDKRVSRSHALLHVVDKKLYLTPTHTNPCFLRRQDTKEQTVMTKDVKTLLNNGDIFGLLPDQLFYKVLYPQMNGNKVTADKIEEKKEDKKELPNGKPQTDEKPPIDNKLSEDKSKIGDENPVTEETKKEVVKEHKEEKKEDFSNDKTETSENQEAEDEGEEIALPLEKKRPLPDWMHKVSNSTSPQKANSSPKKVTTPAVSKRDPGQKLTKDAVSKAEKEDEDIDENDEEKEEVEVPIPVKISRAKPKRDSDEEEDLEENPSDDDYIPENTPPKKQVGRRQKKHYSDSEENFSDDDDDDDDYAPSKKKSKAKKTPKGKGKKSVAKARQTPSRTTKRNAGRSRKRYKSDDDDDDDALEEAVSPRKRAATEEGGRGRPRRAATQKRGSYVDDPMIEEALEDFASEHSENDGIGEKDSDFDVNDLDSGSDWDKKGKKQKGMKSPKVAKSPRPVTKKGKKKAPRRASKSKNYSDEDDDDDVDDEPYVPRPSKRRGATASQESGESDEDKKKRRRREPCQYGKKCYRKNPVHFRTYCHPGDSSFDEEDKDSSPAKDVKKPKDTNKTTPEKPSRPQRSTAGTRLVPQGAIDDDAPDTYDYNDSFIDDGTQPSDEEDSGQDSDYEGDSKAKKTSKNKKLVAAAD